MPTFATAFAQVFFPALFAAFIMRLPWIGVPLALSAFLLSMRFMGRESPLPDLMVLLGTSLALTAMLNS